MYMRNVALIIGLLLLISMVFAGGMTATAIGDITPSSDNVKSYDKATQTVTIAAKDDQTLIATAKLLTPLVVEVSPGYQKVAEILLDGKVITTDFLKQMYFFNNYTGKGIEREFDLRIPVEYLVEEPIYDNVCTKFDKNESEYCEYKEVGTQQVIKIRYDLLTEKNIGVEKKIITIWTNVLAGDNVEWVPDLYGVVVEEWATWTTPTDVNLAAWYKMNELTGTTMIDSKGYDNNGLTFSIGLGGTGKIDTGYGFFGSSTNYVDTYNRIGTGTNSFSITAWIYPKNPVENDGIVISRGASYNGISMHGSDSLYGTIGGTACTGATGKVGANRWNFVAMTYDGANIRIYADGNLIGLCAKTGNISLDANWFVGKDTAVGTFNFDGNMDEVALWTTALSSGDLNNLRVAPGNTGVTYCGGGYTELFDNPCESPSPPAVIDVNALTPTLNQLTSRSRDINVMVSNTTRDGLNLKAYWSNAAGAKTNLIIEDTNLYNSASGFTCSPDYNFQAAGRSCKYTWNTVTTNGMLWGNNFYIDWVLTYSDGNTSEASSPVFYLDNNGPRTSISGCSNPTGWNNTAQILNFDVNEQSWEFGLYTAGNSIFIYDNFAPFLTGFQPGVTPNYQSAYTVSSDGNHIIDLNSFDANNNYTPQTGIYGRTKYWCAIDTSAPTVGATTINTFSTYDVGGHWIKGTGNIIGGAATDGLSGLNTSTCQYTSNNGASWAGNTWNTDHCETIGFAINNSITYTFNTRIRNNAATYGEGTATLAYIGDTTGPTITSNAAPPYYNNTTITLAPNDGAGSGVKRTWYCSDTTNTCTPNTIGTSVALACTNGTICTYYIRAVSMDNLDTNGAAYASGAILIDRQTAPPVPVNESNKYTWLDLMDSFAGSLFGFDYTILGIMGLILFAVIAFVFKIDQLVAIIISIPITFMFLVLAGGVSFILSALVVLEVAALVLKIAISFFNTGNQGA